MHDMEFNESYNGIKLIFIVSVTETNVASAGD